MVPLPALQPPSPDRRDLVIAQLSEHFAAGRLEMEQLEQRIDLALKVATVAELDALVADLGANQPALASEPAPAPARSALQRADKRISVALFSGFERKGVWRPATRHYGLAMFGGFTLDFRDADLVPGETDVYLLALWGGVQVIVPPDLDVETSGFAMLGGVNELSRHPPGAEGRPRLRIHGTAVMGGIEVKVRKRRERLPEQGEEEGRSP